MGHVEDGSVIEASTPGPLLALAIYLLKGTAQVFNYTQYLKPTHA